MMFVAPYNPVASTPHVLRLVLTGPVASRTLFEMAALARPGLRDPTKRPELYNP